MTHIRPAQNRGCELSAEIRSLFKRERIETGMSTQEAARRIGTHVRAFEQMENGDMRGGRARTHRYETLQLWAGLFGYEIVVSVTKREGF